MTLVAQTKFHGETEKGNCLAACVASIFECSIDDVGALEDLPPGEWIDALQRWLNLRGYDWEVSRQDPAPELPESFSYLAIGQSQRGDYRHCVVYQSGRMAHDPHPSGAGLRTVETYWIFAALGPGAEKDEA